MFARLYRRASTVAAHTTAPYAAERQRFLQHCSAQGYTSASLQRIAAVLRAAATDLHRHGGLEVDRSRLEAAATRVAAGHAAAGSRRRAYSYRGTFVRVATRWLLYTGQLQAPPVGLRAYAALVADFVRWMAEERGLSPATIGNRRWHVDRLLDWLDGRGRALADLRMCDLDAYLQHLHAQGLSRVSIRIHPNAMRAFLRHGATRGWCAAGLADALHGPLVYRDAGLPLGPPWEQVMRLIADAASDRPADVRDRAILLLLSVYGLRANEVAHLRLEDVDWVHDQLVVHRPKQGRAQVYPLVPVVGQAIIRYLTEVRPQTALRQLFVRMLAPAGPMTSGSLYEVVARRINRLGIQAPHRGPHLLRHACARHLLAGGLSLKEIGDHLGHRSLDSTRVYAKVDLDGLREVAAFDLGEVV